MAARGAAWRRRQRRLRSMLRHERQTVRMELGAALHHSWSGELVTYKGLRAQKTASAGPAEHFELSSDDGRPAGAERPAALLEPRLQGDVQRHAGIGYELAQNLDVPVLQMGEQLPDVLQLFASFLPVVAEQVIEVPKIFLDTTPQRLEDCLRQPQMADQLVDVPTVVSYSSLQQLTAEQIVDIPVPGGDGGGGRGGLQSSLPRQNSAAVHVEQTVDIPVPGRAGGGGRGGLQSSLPRQNSAAREQTVDIPVPGRAGGGRRGGLEGFPGQGSTASSSHVSAADDARQGGFRTFPRMKKSAKRGPHSGSELGADFNPSTLSAHQMPPEQLVDVPVPQVPERLGSRELLQVFRRLQEEEEVNLWRVHNALQGVEQMDVGEEEEVVEDSRFLPHFRPRRWCWYVRAGGICPRGWDCTFAHHESVVHCAGGWLGLGSGAWHPLDPSWVPLPVLRGRLNILEARGQGLGIP